MKYLLTAYLVFICEVAASGTLQEPKPDIIIMSQIQARTDALARIGAAQIDSIINARDTVIGRVDTWRLLDGHDQITEWYYVIHGADTNYLFPRTYIK